MAADDEQALEKVRFYDGFQLMETMIPMTKRTAQDRVFVCCVLSAALWLTSCNFTHDGRTAFQASETAAMRTRQFHVELERQKMGNFKNSQALDCDARYFYDKEVVERSPEGIESGVTLSQGRPSGHQETETLFAEGKTYGRNASSWENAPGNDDAHPEWGPLIPHRSFDTQESHAFPLIREESCLLREPELGGHLPHRQLKLKGIRKFGGAEVAFTLTLISA